MPRTTSGSAARTWGLAGLGLAVVAIPFGIVLLAVGGHTYSGIASVLAGSSAGLKAVGYFYERRRR